MCAHLSKIFAFFLEARRAVATGPAWLGQPMGKCSRAGGADRESGRWVRDFLKAGGGGGGGTLTPSVGGLGTHFCWCQFWGEHFFCFVSKKKGQNGQKSASSRGPSAPPPGRDRQIESNSPLLNGVNRNSDASLNHDLLLCRNGLQRS